MAHLTNYYLALVNMYLQVPIYWSFFWYALILNGEIFLTWLRKFFKSSFWISSPLCVEYFFFSPHLQSIKFICCFIIIENCYIVIWILFNWPMLQVLVVFSIHECVKGCKYFHILSILEHEGFFFCLYQNGCH